VFHCFETFFKDSTELSAEDRLLIEARVRHHYATNKTRRFVLCHGTDTMIETGKYLKGTNIRNEFQVYLRHSCGGKVSEIEF
jgi:L-asparaginase/Glu-tRNA(Gln) amidotransferase subunit D